MTSPIKVLHLLHDSRRSGVPAVASSLLVSLDRSHVEPAVLFAYDGVYAEDLREAGIEVMTLGRRRPLVWRFNRFLAIIRLCFLAQRFDVIHAHSVKMAPAALCAKLFGARVVFHLHELPGRVGFMVRAAMRMADCTVFCSESCANYYATLPAKRRRTIVNAMRFDDRPPVRHGRQGGKVAAIGSINRNKGQDLIVRAFARLNPLDSELWLYGTTGLSAHGFVRRLKQLVARHGLAGRVFFPGPTRDVFAVLEETALLVHMSWSESFGMALVEAMSRGVPVIAHDLQGMREVVADGVTGFLIPPGDVAVLAARMGELLAAPDLRNRMGEAGYRMVRERYDAASRASEYEELYEELSRQ